jgi:5-methyltetrahydropteroyltriglutamate--homocysteine methyltransferase
MNLRASLTGPFPRPESLVAATRDLDRGRTTPDAVEELFVRTESEVVEIERRLGLDPVTGGYLRWADVFRPIAETWAGFTVGPVTRWFETNTFFRQPILHAPPERVPGALAARLPVAARTPDAGKAKVILPGPYTFAGLLDNRSGETVESLIHRLGRLLGAEVKELRGLGYTVFQFQEPLLVVTPPTGPRAEAVTAAYRAIAESSEGATTILWTYFGDAAPTFPLLAHLPVGVLGVDLAETDVAALTTPIERKGIGLGCLDPRTTLVEDASEVAAIVRRVQEKLHPSSVWLGPGGPLDLLPWEPARRKLHVLPAAIQSVSAGAAR